jgi:hypothetical protein
MSFSKASHRWALALALATLSLLPRPCAGTEEYTFTTLAGPSEAGPGAVDGSGSAARFQIPGSVATDSAGNLYVADTGNHTLRKVTPDGLVTTLAGLAESPGCADGKGSQARFKSPWGITADGAGNLYVADSENCTIRKVMPDGTVTTLAGVVGQSETVDGPGSTARFAGPQILAADAQGTLYVAEGFAIRKVTSSGEVTTFAGRVDTAGSVDGTGTGARFNGPSGLVVDSAGDLYVADGSGCQVRKVTAAGVVTTLAGTVGSRESKDGTGSTARFVYPSAAVVDRNGNLLVVDSSLIRQVSPAGVVTTVLDMAQSNGFGFFGARSLATDPAGTFYVSDTWSHAIGKITGTNIAWFAGGGVLRSFETATDGIGTAARFRWPHAVAVDTTGNLYVADCQLLRKVTPDGMVTTLAGSAENTGEQQDGVGAAARFSSLNGVAVDSVGNVYVTDSCSAIRKVTPDGVVTTLAGQAGQTGKDNGKGGDARFDGLMGIAVDSTGNLYVSETGNSTIRKVTTDGVVNSVAGLAGTAGKADGTGSAARFSCPWGVAVDKAGIVYVADEQNHTIRKITPEGIVTTLAGLAENPGSDDGMGSAARFNGPRGIGVDSAGNVYETDDWACTVRKITPAGVVSTIGGLPGTRGSADGSGSAARFGIGFDMPGPSGLAVDNAGRVYVADTFNGSIRIGRLTACPDQPTVDLTLAPVGQVRQLDTFPQTAVAWQWTLIRRPAGSTAALSNPAVRNPTFTPDIADLYVFRLRATNALGDICIRTVQLTTVQTNAVLVTSPRWLPGGSFQFSLVAETGQKHTIQSSRDLRTWLDWTNVTPATFMTQSTDGSAASDAHRFYRARRD